MDFISRGADNMANFERQLDIVGNNIGNLQTPGFRAQRILYQQSASGNVAGTVSVTPNEGELQATHVPTDLAVQGEGYFVVQGQNGRLYTRDGSFHMDPQGRLLFGQQNLAVLGYGASNGVVNEGLPLSPINIPVGRQTVSSGSTTATATGNLDAGAAVYAPATASSAETGGIQRVQMSVFDSLGLAHTVDVTLTKTGLNEWTWSAAPSDATTLSPAEGRITFDSAGVCATPLATLTLNPQGGGAQGQQVSLDFSSITQLAGASTATVQADSFQTGTLASFTVGSDGVITGHYSTGTAAVLGRIPLARFANPAGLQQADENLLVETSSSGAAIVGAGGQGSFGTIEQGNLEGSNTNITVEFSRMLIAQRAFQANSRLVRTGDEMWQDLLDLKR